VLARLLLALRTSLIKTDSLHVFFFFFLEPVLKDNLDLATSAGLLMLVGGTNSIPFSCPITTSNSIARPTELIKISNIIEERGK